MLCRKAWSSYPTSESCSTITGVRLPLQWVDAPPAMTAEQARSYCAQLARSHYENFQVVSFLLPAKLHQDFYN